MTTPLSDPVAWLPDHVRAVVERATPIVTFAGRAADIAARSPDFVRSDIGQVIGVDREAEVLYGPPVGLPEAREAVAELYRVSLGLPRLSGANVCMCTGAAEGLSLLLRCFAHGRVVGLPRGHWENYDNAVSLAGGQVAVVDFFDDQGALDLDRLEAQIEDLQVEVLLVNFPCNPTGAVLTTIELAGLGALLRRLEVLAIADEVYAHLRYDGVAPRSLLAEAPEHTIGVGAASKQYLLPGARAGWVVCADERVTDVILRRVLRGSTASPNVLGQRRLVEALQPDLAAYAGGKRPPNIERVRGAMATRRDALVRVLRKHGMLPENRRSAEGTIFLMAQLPAWFDGDDVAFAERALATERFSCIPGSAFGLPGLVRLSFGALGVDAIGRLDAHLSAWAEEARVDSR